MAITTHPYYFDYCSASWSKTVNEKQEKRDRAESVRRFVRLRGADTDIPEMKTAMLEKDKPLAVQLVITV